MMSKASPLNPSKKVYFNGTAVNGKNIPFVITKGPVSGKVLARGNTVNIVDGQIVFPPNLTLNKHIGEEVTVVLAWPVKNDYNFLVYEYER
jgi:hypothetical protein